MGEYKPENEGNSRGNFRLISLYFSPVVHLCVDTISGASCPSVLHQTPASYHRSGHSASSFINTIMLNLETNYDCSFGAFVYVIC